ncbi:MAG: hypothetical protein LBU73_06255 [Helicobacteraceae bacterium]|jgi:hypothetical protein|nr:hypothetical protein [Helicobacteraceae bacterium]
MRIFAIVLMFFWAAGAQAFESYAKYNVKYSWFELGDAIAKLSIDGDRYVTEVSAKSKKMAATFSGNRQETYRSEGRVIKENGQNVLLPEKLEWRMKSTNKSRYIIWIFDHENEIATMVKEECDSKKKCNHETTMLEGEKYSRNDILTIYHNITNNFMKSPEKNIEVNVVGSRKRARVEKPEGKLLKAAQENLGLTSGNILVVHLNQELFSSADGALFVLLDDDNIVKKAVIVDTVLFGDVVGDLVEKKVN